MTPTATDSAPNRTDRINTAFAQEERAGLTFALWARLAVLGVLASYVLVTLPLSRSLGYFAAIVVFMALGLAPHLLRRFGLRRIGWTMAFTLLEVGLLTYLLVVPAPFLPETWSPQINLRVPNFLYLGVFLIAMALSYSPALVVWTGAAAMAAWSAGTLWVLSLPNTIASSSRDTLDRLQLSPQQIVEQFLHPNFVALTIWYNQLVFLALVTMILAITVWRSRRLVRGQVLAESARASLSRYFSPNLVDELAKSEGGFDQVSSQKVAILFADMVGFTTISETMKPEAIVALLRDFLGRLARTVFAYRGTLDKYMGDAVMAHFGTPRPGGDDASRALNCAVAMVREIGTWNAERAKAGEPPIRIGVGLHYGEVVAGNIGDERRLEYTVLGDAVNVASRLEALTRKAKSPLLVSDALIEAVKSEGLDLTNLGTFTKDRAHTVKGRAAPVAVWKLIEKRLLAGSR